MATRFTLQQIDDKFGQLDITVHASSSGNGNITQPSQGGGGGGGRARTYIKLPTLQLRKFHGKAHKRTKFWDPFKASVDNNPSPSPVLKLEYLKTQQEEAAYQAITNLQLSDGNYK